MYPTHKYDKFKTTNAITTYIVRGFSGKDGVEYDTLLEAQTKNLGQVISVINTGGGMTRLHECTLIP